MPPSTEEPGGPLESASLARQVGLPGAMLLGLGSILGTGVFVSIGVAAGAAGAAVLLAVPLAGAIALCNGLSSAQLAAAHPVSGGTYEYGYRLLSPAWGFTAGWAFLLAKGASAATAALGLTGYVLGFAWRDGPGAPAPSPGGVAGGDPFLVAGGLVVVAGVSALVAGGIRRSTRATGVMVTFTLGAFALFLGAGLHRIVTGDAAAPPVMADLEVAGLLHATALLFVAYTGYGRIATLGEEVREPERTIPRAVVGTLALVFALYLGVAFVAVATVGAPAFARSAETSAAPLLPVAEVLAVPGMSAILAAAAVTAMLGVLLNLILGLSRVALAMARRGDLPAVLARVAGPTVGPRAAVLAVGGVVALLVLVGDVRITWSFSAFTVLIYYATTNLAALRLGPGERWYPRWVPAAGLVGCLAVAFAVEPGVWLTGLGLLAAGLGLRSLLRVHSGSRRG